VEKRLLPVLAYAVNILFLWVQNYQPNIMHNFWRIFCVGFSVITFRVILLRTNYVLFTKICYTFNSYQHLFYLFAQCLKVEAWIALITKCCQKQFYHLSLNFSEQNNNIKAFRSYQLHKLSIIGTRRAKSNLIYSDIFHQRKYPRLKILSWNI